jgi:hypothetical protein
MSPGQLEALRDYIASMSDERFRMLIEEGAKAAEEDLRSRLVGKTQRVLTCSAAEAAPIVDRILERAEKREMAG